MRRAVTGFTLVEVVLALIVFEVGMLGVVSMVVIAARSLSRAEWLERSLTLAYAVIDSLSLEGAPGAGERTHAAGSISWILGIDGNLSLESIGPDGSVLFHVATRLEGS